MSTSWLNPLVATTVLPVFVAAGVVTILVVLAITFLNYSRKSNPENDLFGSSIDRLLFLLLFVAVFTLGAFIMYVFLI
jgi:type IV secretory pathway TrbL component